MAPSFVALGLDVEGRMVIEGEFVDTVISFEEAIIVFLAERTG